MIPIVTPEQMRLVDAAATEPVEELIERAGRHVAQVARRILGGVYGRRVTVIAGPGNNGADARVAARLLASWGVGVEIVAASASSIPRCDLVIDGAFGTGMNRPYTPPQIPAETPVLAIDIPTGVDGLTGEPHGEPLRATHTVTFVAMKPGLLLPPGAQFAGTVEVADIGLDVGEVDTWLFDEADARRLMPRRHPTDHKWSRALWVVGGSPGMWGAPLLASTAALRSGTGLVFCGLPGQPAPALPSEVVFRSLTAAGWHEPVLASADRFGAIVIGCGMAVSADAASAIHGLIAATSLPLVLDGGALRMLGERPTLRRNIVLTPHAGEFAAAAGSAPGADRFDAARSLAVDTGATVVLKGPLTIVASPDGSCIASNRGDERLGTAGSGDVLAGTIGSYLAAGMRPDHAAALGAWIHGEAGRTQGRFGMVASDLVDGLRIVANRLGATVAHGEDHASH